MAFSKAVIEEVVTYSALGSNSTFAINPDILSHNAALLVQRHVLGELYLGQNWNS
jgi:hypothetical protein